MKVCYNLGVYSFIRDSILSTTLLLNNRKGNDMKLSLHEVAKVVGAKNQVSEFEDVPWEILNLIVVISVKVTYFFP